jgi:imidazoleglycerol-phosphate dehydratase
LSSGEWSYLTRKTRETEIEVKLRVYGKGEGEIETGIGFFDHMLETFVKHSGVDLILRARGDLEVDYHHTVEDVGILLGEALREQVYPVQNIERFANVVAPLDEAAVEVDLDIGGRPYLVYQLPTEGAIRDFDLELVEEFFKSLVFNFRIALHLILLRGRNRHHIVESAFKGFGVALRRGLAPRPGVGVPSTKGVL